MIEFVLDRLENVMGKRKQCWLPALFSLPPLFQQCVQKLSFSALLKFGIVW